MSVNYIELTASMNYDFSTLSSKSNLVFINVDIITIIGITDII